MSTTNCIVWIVCNATSYEEVYTSRKDAETALRDHRKDAKNCGFLPKFDRIERCRLKYEKK